MSDSIQELIERCRGLSNDSVFRCIEALVVGGSVRLGQYDDLSDLDLFLLISDCDRHEFLNRTMRLLADRIGTVVFYRGPVFVESFGYSFTVLYEPMVVCQFNVNDSSTLTSHPMRALKAIVCFDRTGYYTNFLSNF